MFSEQPSISTPARLTPEQSEHFHVELLWDWRRDIFVCNGCGAEFVLPELSAVMLLSAQSE